MIIHLLRDPLNSHNSDYRRKETRRIKAFLDTHLRKKGPVRAVVSNSVIVLPKQSDYLDQRTERQEELTGNQDNYQREKAKFYTASHREI